MKKFEHTFKPGPGERVIHYGKAFDPEGALALGMRHGVESQARTETAQSLVNPPMRSTFEHSFIERLSKVYASERTRQLVRF